MPWWQIWLVGNECANISEPDNKECYTLKEEVNVIMVLSEIKIVPSTVEQKHPKNQLQSINSGTQKNKVIYDLLVGVHKTTQKLK